MRSMLIMFCIISMSEAIANSHQSMHTEPNARCVAVSPP
jgi:hypothetical protein